MTTNTDGAMPELPEPTYIYHTSDEEGGDDLFEFAHSGAVDIDEHYEGGVCSDCVRLYTADQMREYARAAIQQAAGAVPEGCRIVPMEPSKAMLDRAVAFALNVSIGGSYGWTDYMRDLYARMLSAVPSKAGSSVHLGGGEGGGVPLTELELGALYKTALDHWNDDLINVTFYFARAIEAAHGIGKASRPESPTGQINKPATVQGIDGGDHV